MHRRTLDVWTVSECNMHHLDVWGRDKTRWDKDYLLSETVWRCVYAGISYTPTFTCLQLNVVKAVEYELLVLNPLSRNWWVICNSSTYGVKRYTMTMLSTRLQHFQVIGSVQYKHTPVCDIRWYSTAVRTLWQHYLRMFKMYSNFYKTHCERCTLCNYELCWQLLNRMKWHCCTQLEK